jgi:hypothetical protein
MFWTFTLSFDVEILAFFGLATALATFKKIGPLKQNSGHPGASRKSGQIFQILKWGTNLEL